MASVEEVVNKATDKNQTSEDWNSIIELCQMAKNGRARDIINCLKKKILDQNTNTILYALTTTDSLVKNCKLNVHQEISSRGFLDTLVKQLNNKNVHEIVKEKILYLIQQWKIAFEYDNSLSYCKEVYNNLKRQNYKFVEPRPLGNRENRPLNNEELIEKEKEELQLALALSLSTVETNQSNTVKPREHTSHDSEYHQHSQPQSQPNNKTIFKVKALYDFLGNYAEGELPLYRGDIINVYEATFKDWWKGENRGMVGIFPNNYVEKISDSANSRPVNDEYENQVIRDSQKIDEFMQMLATIDPKTENLSENDNLQNMYNSICTLRPKLVKLVEFYNKKKEESTLLTKKFLQAERTYQQISDSAAALVYNQTQTILNNYPNFYPQSTQPSINQYVPAQGPPPSYQVAVVSPQFNPQINTPANIIPQSQPLQYQPPQAYISLPQQQIMYTPQIHDQTNYIQQ